MRSETTAEVELGPADLKLLPLSEVETRQAILNDLESADMDERSSRIDPAHVNTFRWIFEPPQNTGSRPADTPPWSNFVSWLEQEDASKIYWITGKPGSGKSTLMKYIADSGRLERHLERWANGQPLRVAVFYAWNAGTDEQHSETGLLKSLLYQYLKQMPELIPTVCPRRWDLYRISGTGRERGTLPDWDETELRQAFDTLLPLAPQKNQKLALLIDGLDEFRSRNEFQSLLSFAEAVWSKGGAKVCTSSREWSVFANYFRMHPSLRIQDLTRNDTERYIYNRLGESVAYAELKASHSEDVDKLVTSLLDRASGVFLWVRIVTDVVLSGMDAGQTVNELNAKVKKLPLGLSKLYQGIWNGLDPEDQTNVARMLRILEVSLFPLDATTLFAAEQLDAAEELKQWAN